MIPHEGVEGTQLYPSNTQLTSSVCQKATYICSDHGNSKQIGIQDACGTDDTSLVCWLTVSQNAAVCQRIKLTSFLVFNTCTPNNNKPAQTDTAAAPNTFRSPDATQNLQVLHWYHAMKAVFEIRLMTQSRPATACASSSPVFLSLTRVHQTCTQTDTAAAPNTFRSPHVTQNLQVLHWYHAMKAVFEIRLMTQSWPATASSLLRVWRENTANHNTHRKTSQERWVTGPWRTVPVLTCKRITTVRKITT